MKRRFSLSHFYFTRPITKWFHYNMPYCLIWSPSLLQISTLQIDEIHFKALRQRGLKSSTLSWKCMSPYTLQLSLRVARTKNSIGLCIWFHFIYMGNNLFLQHSKLISENKIGVLIMFFCSKSDFYLFDYVTIIKLLNIWIWRGRLNRISFRKILERRFWLDRIMGCKFALNFCFVRLANFVLFSNDLYHTG